MIVRAGFFIENMTFTNRVTTITQNFIMPKNYDNFFGDNSFLPYRVIGNGQSWRGTTLDIPITIGKNTLGSSFSGMQTASNGAQQTRALMSYDLRAYRIPVTIPGLDKVVNKGEEKILAMVEQEMATAFESLLEDVSDMLYGDGTGNSSQDFLGADALYDDGTSAATIGGLSRTTYTTLKGTRTASGGTISLDKLATFFMDLTSGSGLKNRPSMFSSDETTWNYLEKLIVTGTVQANYQANGYPMVTRKSKTPVGGLSGEAGFQSILYRGVPIIWDENSTAQTLWGHNENFTGWFGAQSDDLKSIQLTTLEGSANGDAPSTDTGLQWSGFKDSFDQFGEVAYIYLLGNWVAMRPGRLGRITGIAGV